LLFVVLCFGLGIFALPVLPKWLLLFYIVYQKWFIYYFNLSSAAQRESVCLVHVHFSVLSDAPQP